MKNSFVALYLPEGRIDLSKNGFKTQKDAYQYIEQFICEDCKVALDRGYVSYPDLPKTLNLKINRVTDTPCGHEWAVIKESVYNRCIKLINIFTQIK